MLTIFMVSLVQNSDAIKDIQLFKKNGGRISSVMDLMEKEEI